MKDYAPLKTSTKSHNKKTANKITKKKTNWIKMIKALKKTISIPHQINNIFILNFNGSDIIK